MAKILRIANLCKTYNISNTIKQEVLKGINLEFEKGEMVALLGESGCGKSTLINIIGGLDNEYTGSVVIRGKFIRDFNENEMDDYRKKTIGLIFQNYNLISHMTLKENVEIAMKMTDVEKEERESRALDLLDLVGLKAHANKYPNQLSGGQKQRVAIARSLANNPSIILADEPTGALDKDSTVQILDILEKIAKMGKLVIIVTHSQVVATRCQRTIKIDDGVIISDERKEKPFENKYEKYVEVKPKSIKTKDISKLSLTNLLSNKARSLLVSIGISIGIAALILILALSSGITSYVKEYYSSDTSNTLITVTSDAKYSTISSSKISSINSISGTSRVIESHTARVVSYEYGEISSTISKIYEDVSINSLDIVYGSELENANDIIVDLDFAIEIATSPVAAIGTEISLTHNGYTQSFNIVGIYDSSEDSSAYILSSGMNLFNSSSINTIYVLAKDITYVDSVQDEIQNLGLIATTTSDEASTVLDYIDLSTKVLTAVSLIAMVVSGIMIIIVMHISVVERTHEIGVLRSIGARKKDISNIFMVEAAMLGILGGVIGIGISLSIATIVNIICKITADYMFISYNPLFYILGLLISVVISAISGIAPSKKASNLDPIEALRFE